MLAIELIVILALIVLNGLLALSELALVSARRSKLRAMTEARVRGAAAALELAERPGRFLSAIQIGITLIGVLAGAISGTTLGQRFADQLFSMGLPQVYADSVGIGVVVVAATYLSVVLGELAPKQMALAHPERIAARVAPAMLVMSRLMSPAVTLLDGSGRFVLRLLGATPPVGSAVSDEEIRALISEAERAGVIEPEERSMIAQVMRLADRQVRAVMTPRTDVDMVDLSAEPEEIRTKLRTSVHSRLPAHHGLPDEIVGVIQAKDLLDAHLADAPFDPRQYVREAVVVPDTADVLDVIERLKQSPVHMALVHDEYGYFQGLVTTADILEAITGAFRTEEGPPEPKIVRRADGSWLIGGDLAADELAELLGIGLPARPNFTTTAGFLLTLFGHLPTIGEDVTYQGWTFEVVDLDGRRIDKIQVRRAHGMRRSV